MKVKLLDDENVLIECRHHWSLFLLPLIFIVIALFCLRLDSLLELFGFIFFTISIGTYYWALKRYFSHRYLLTNKRLIIIESWLGSSSTDVLIDKIEGIKVKVIPFTTNGSITILCSGGNSYHYKALKSPQTLRDTLINR